MEIGWTFLVRDHWGGATNREVKTLMLLHAFKTVPRVIFKIGVNNSRSRHAVEKIGAQYVGSIEMFDGEGVLYRLDQVEFREREVIGTQYVVDRILPKV